MIRTILLSATLLAVAGVAQASQVRVSLSGKTEAAIHEELAQAAKAACEDVSVTDYAPCIQETYNDALRQVAKMKATKLASATY